MKQKKTEFIAVGTELLLGQIANTNAAWFSKQLTAFGFNMYHHTVVGDNLQRVKEAFMQAQERSDIIIVSGGLGPTEDDLTREAFQEMAELPLVYDPETLDKIEQFYEKQELTMTDNNKRQARIFETAKILTNKYGMAPGMLVTHNNTRWIFLPGVPKEMKQIANDSVFPYLIQQMTSYERIQSRVIKCIGIGESTLEEKLSDLIVNQSNPTIALLAEDEGMTIRLTVKATSETEAQQMLGDMTLEIQDRIGMHMFGFDQDTIVKKVIQLLEKKQHTISAAESLTGGAFTHKLMQEEGVSNVSPGSIISYGAHIKRDVLHIPEDLIQTHGVVSEECAVAMAKNIHTSMETSLGISFTGVAGPTTLEGNEVGTTYISIYSAKGPQVVRKYVFAGNRMSIQNRAVMKGFELLYHFLNE